ncbi:hypothetical protein ACIBTV_29385 [Micromonospora sp. NPDC049366]
MSSVIPQCRVWFCTGDALLLAMVYACPGANCDEVRAERVVRIVR